MTRKFKGTSSVAMTSNPRLVDSSFQCRSVYQPIPNKDPVIKAKITNGANGIFSNLPVVHRLITSAMEQPTINNPPSNSPQKMLRCSMNEANTSRRARRGGAEGMVGLHERAFVFGPAIAVVAYRSPGAEHSAGRDPRSQGPRSALTVAR